MVPAWAADLPQEVTDAAPPAAEELEGKDFSGGIAALLEQGTTLLGEALRENLRGAVALPRCRARPRPVRQARRAARRSGQSPWRHGPRHARPEGPARAARRCSGGPPAGHAGPAGRWPGPDRTGPAGPTSHCGVRRILPAGGGHLRPRAGPCLSARGVPFISPFADHGSQPYVWQCVEYWMPRFAFPLTEISIPSSRFALPLVPLILPFVTGACQPKDWTWVR